ncbi:hypothetical protein CCACVL1_12951 [Corchorus capsularis]|uniref:Uncharacterized protein n=1 Tax=Corchorus capsularis TaxID=210143 RepID=A0A1R3ICW6_COCAP|nr:hypothetical protein CCACVL1_12951 [Corchorus capsularis]
MCNSTVTTMRRSSTANHRGHG